MNKRFIWSKYNSTIKLDNDEFLVYNTYSNSLIVLDSQEYLFVQAAMQNDTDNIPDDLLTEFKKMKMIVEDDEILFSKIKLARLANRFRNDHLSLTVVPTLACNFRCPYCFENGIQRSQKMSKRVQDAFAEYINKLPSSTKISLTWYGGEPLLAFDVIENILGQIQEREITHSLMVTNGYLLNETNLQKLKDCNINSIQITLDGKKEQHNVRRPHFHNSDSFEKILANLQLIPKVYPELRVTIRVNLDMENKAEYPSLRKELLEQLDIPKISIYPAFVTDYHENIFGQCAIMNRKEQGMFIKEHLGDCDFEKVFYPSVKTGECAARSAHSFVIGPKGELYKCWCDVGREDKVYATIFDGIRNSDLYTKYLTYADHLNDSKCKECFLFPVCFGGCPFRRIQANGNPNDEFCLANKQDFEEYMKMVYKKMQMSK